MIVIDDVILSDEIVEEQFVCDLSSCKGGCCVDGDCGAPLTEEEALLLETIYPDVKPYLPAHFAQQIEQEGYYTEDEEFGYVTPTINGGICAYGYVEADTSIVKCGIEKAYLEGKISFKKPISCHLYPIRIKESGAYEMVNYEPRKDLCKAACKLGRKLKVPVYVFLKEPLERKYGPSFYEVLDRIARKEYDV